jgi:superfamily II DNA or RNA helicase
MSDLYENYNKAYKEGNYQKAYKYLERLLKYYPDDIDLLKDIIDISVYKLKKLHLARPWMIQVIKYYENWPNYLPLANLEASLGNLSTARMYIEKAKELSKIQKGIKNKKEIKQRLGRIEDFINYKEYELKNDRSVKAYEKKKAKETPVKKSSPLPEKTEKIEEKIPIYHIPVKFVKPSEKTIEEFKTVPISDLKETFMLLSYERLAVQGSFDELLCLNVLSGVDRYWYQVESAKKVLKHFRGRVLLCDEVGLGKTVEAGMIIKEYLMRGMARNVIILTPPPLVTQWKEEMSSKFGLSFLTTDDVIDTEKLWKEKFIIASVNTAKNKKNMPFVTEEFYDIVVVDEAHHLRNRNTLSWKLINQMKKKFILLLSATPVQNNLIELYNLITLLKPGQFKTEKLFKEEYLVRGNLRKPKNRDKLRELLGDVMIRNTRSAIDLKLPRRFASTIRLEPSDIERKIYSFLQDFVRKENFKKPFINLLLREAGSSPFALKKTLDNIAQKKDIIQLIDSLKETSKGKALLELIKKNPEEKKIIFTQYLKTMDYITDLLVINKIPFVTFRGDMSTKDKNEAIERFRDDMPVLVSTESGGEGRNIQFCRTIINFDLPWNPMRIEQRIGRLHRIGQTGDVFIFNLSVKDTVEDYIIEILDNKINMFEMVIGEIEPILGHLSKEDEDFEDLILNIWLKSSSDKEVKDGFNMLGEELVRAKSEYLKGKDFDEEIFGEDYEM